MREISTIVEAGKSENTSGYRLLDECSSGKSLLDCAKSGGEQENFDRLGFPKIDMTGFGQEAPYKGSGIADYVRHVVGRSFINDESYGDKLKRSVESQMTAQERKQFENEEKAINQHKRDVLNWGLKSTLNSEAYPKAPNSPMHDLIAKRVEETEAAIAQQVRRGMVPEQQSRLDEQLKDFREATKKANELGDPLGTGGMFKKKPEPGPAVKHYFSRIGAATEEYLKRH